MKNEFRMVSVDSSTKKTGISLFINGELQETKLIDLSSCKEPTDERINMMGSALIILLSTWHPSMVYAEEPKGHGSNLELVRKLAEVLGVIRGWCIDNSAEYHEVKPSEWRSYLGLKQGGKVKREELKRESIEYVRNKYNILVNDDVADSICIGDAMISKYNEDNEI